MLDIRPLIDTIEQTVRAHQLDRPGAYRRWLWQDDAGTRDLTINAYGCADAANILFTIGRFPGESAVRDAWIATLQEFQSPDTGLFMEATHHPIHTTAHCIAALELFDARPRHLLTALFPYLTPEGLEEFLDDLDWRTSPWNASHQGAGIFAALVLAREAPEEWEDVYFDWLWQQADPDTGLWRRGEITTPGAAPLFHHLAGSFHYLFNHEYARRPLRYPDRMVDTCLRVEAEGAIPGLGRGISFAEIDWIYCLNRALRQSSCAQVREARQALREFAIDYIDYLRSLPHAEDDAFNDLHALFGAVCALAELQQAVPGLIRTETPLRLVLDRRPFI